MLSSKRILLIVGGGIAAYKVLDLVRRLKERGAAVRAVMTAAAAEFVTPLSLGTVTGERVFTDLFDLADEHDVGHIALSRDTDLVLVAPATADLMARMASGMANDLATACLLATAAPVVACPAMNPRMWAHPATRRNVERLVADGVRLLGPADGAMAERGESGTGRLMEPLEIVAALEALFAGDPATAKAGPGDAGRVVDDLMAVHRPAPAAVARPAGRLSGLRAIVTSGPTHEPIDPVRYIANRSSGKQGHAIAAALARAGAEVVLVSGPVAIADPPSVMVVRVETARQMLAAVEAALPADIAVMAAAVADWRAAEETDRKIKKDGGAAPRLLLAENPDILRTVGHHRNRPRLVVGFAAETNDVVANGRAKLARKGADIIVANDVSPAGGVMGGERNTVHLIAAADGAAEPTVEDWPTLGKAEVAERLVARIADALERTS